MLKKFLIEIFIPFVLLAALIVNPPHELDYWIAQQFYDPNLGWVLHKHFFFAQIMTWITPPSRNGGE